MITVTIGNESRNLQDALTGGWIPERINRRRFAGASVCVRVEIQQPPEVRLALSTPGCPSGPAAYRPLTAREREIVALWESLRLNDADWNVGTLTAFLRRLVRLAA